jgi:hypothetical protein
MPPPSASIAVARIVAAVVTPCRKIVSLRAQLSLNAAIMEGVASIVCRPPLFLKRLGEGIRGLC